MPKKKLSQIKALLFVVVLELEKLEMKMEPVKKEKPARRSTAKLTLIKGGDG